MRGGLRKGLLALGLAVLALPALAAPDWSLPPRLKADRAVAPPVVARSSGGGPRVSLPPRLKPGRAAPEGSGPGLPAAGPEIVAIGGTQSLCGSRGIRGERLRPIRGSLAACGAGGAVRVSSIEGIAITPAAVMTCDMAKATRDWLKDGAVPAWGRLGRGLKGIGVAASYDCRGPGGPEGAAGAEHGRAQALDVASFALANGLTVTVRDGWRDPFAGQVLRRVHEAACKPFTNALGPDAGPGFRDHFHLDLARGRGRCR